MAAAGEGPSSGYGVNGGGAGGKFRKRPFRKAAHATPYDRPPAPGGNPSWLSKIVVQPASRLIASSAQRFFASVFRKRLPPPPPPETRQSNERPEAAVEAEVQAQEAVVCVNSNSLLNPVNDGISELEHALKKKTFTRSEIDHLTELLQSRAEDGSRKSDFRTEIEDEKLAANSERQQQYSPFVGKSMPYEFSHGLNVTPAISTRVLEEDIASPAEIAKAYMSNQVSPSISGLRTRAVREEAIIPRSVQYTPKSSLAPLAIKGSHGEGPGNGFVTPRSRGRSAIYSMARTPYSRVHPTAFGKGSGSRLSGFGEPMSTLSVNEQLGELGSNRMALKRRSSVLDEDLGSMGPIRRTRQKPSMLSHTSLHQGIGSSSTARQRPLMDQRPQSGSKLGGENDGLRTSKTIYGYVPSQSTKNAEKVFKLMESITPKPKSPAKLTADMLRGQALKSLDDADSSKILYNNHVSNKVDSGSPSQQTVSTKGKEKIEEIGFQKFDSQSDVSTPAGNGTETSLKGIVKAADFVAKADAQHPPKKPSFKINFDEDLDDEISYDGPTPNVLPIVDTNQEKQNLAADKSLQDKLQVLPDIRTSPESFSGKRLDLETDNSSKAKAASSSLTTAPSNLVFDRILPGSVNGNDNSVSEAAKTNGKIDDSPFVPSSSTSTSGILSSFPTKDNGPPAEIPSFLSKISAPPASTGITNSFLANGISNFASSANVSSSSATTLFTTTSATATLSSTEATVAPKTMFNTESAGNPSISALDAGKESSAGNSSSLVSSSTLFTPPANGIFGFSKPSTAASTGKDFLSSSSGGSLFNAQTSVAGSGAASVSAMAQVQFASSGPFVFGSTPAVASVSSSPSFSSPSLSEAKQLGPSSGGTPGIFSFSAKAPSSETNVMTANSKDNAPFGTTASVTNATDSSTSAPPFGSSTTSAPVSNAIGSSTPVFGNFGGNSSAGNTLSSSSVSAGNFGANPFSSTGLSFGTNSAPAFGSSSGAVQISTPVFGSSSSFQSTSITLAFGSSGGSFQSTSSTPAFGSSGSFQSTISTPAFGSSGSFQSTISAPAFGSSGSFQSATSTPAFGSSGSFQSTFSSPAFGSTASPPVSSGVFASTSSAPSIFGGPSSGSFPSISNNTPAFGSSTQSPFGVQPGFGASAPAFTTPAVNNDQMQEETMAEDTVNPSTPVFGQQPTPSSGYMFGAQPANPFPFTAQQGQAAPQNQFLFPGQQNQAAPQNANPFQASSSLEFNAGGSGFSMGSTGGGGGGDKSGRRIIKPRRNIGGKKR